MIILPLICICCHHLYQHMFHFSNSDPWLMSVVTIWINSCSTSVIITFDVNICINTWFHFSNSNLSLVSGVTTWININSCSTSVILTSDPVQWLSYLWSTSSVTIWINTCSTPVSWYMISINILVEFILIICLKDKNNKEILNQRKLFV